MTPLIKAIDALWRARHSAMRSDPDGLSGRLKWTIGAPQVLADAIDGVLRAAASADRPSFVIEALDVERLARAIHIAMCDRPSGYAKHLAGKGVRCSLDLGLGLGASGIAAEYARQPDGAS